MLCKLYLIISSKRIDPVISPGHYGHWQATWRYGSVRYELDPPAAAVSALSLWLWVRVTECAQWGSPRAFGLHTEGLANICTLICRGNHSSLFFFRSDPLSEQVTSGWSHHSDCASSWMKRIEMGLCARNRLKVCMNTHIVAVSVGNVAC